MSLQLINDECFTEEEERAAEQQQSPKKTGEREEEAKKPRAVKSPEENVNSPPTGEVEKKKKNKEAEQVKGPSNDPPQKEEVEVEVEVKAGQGKEVVEALSKLVKQLPENQATKALREKMTELTKIGIDMAKEEETNRSASSSSEDSSSSDTDTSLNTSEESLSEPPSVHELSKSARKRKRKRKIKKRKKRERLLEKLKKARKELKRKAEQAKDAKAAATVKTRKESLDELVENEQSKGTNPSPGTSTRRESQSSGETSTKRGWQREREPLSPHRMEEDQSRYRIPKMARRDEPTPSTSTERGGSPCPSVAIERVVIRNQHPTTREQEKKEKEEQREKYIDQEKLRLRRRVEDIFPNSQAITAVLTDARWCAPCRAFNIGQCDLAERSHEMIHDRQVKHICSICHHAAGTCNSHTARNCKLDRFLNHEVDRRKEENRRLLASRTERDTRATRVENRHWSAGGPPPYRGGRGRDHRREFNRN